MEGLLVIVFGCGLISLSIWWLLHIVYNYQQSQNQHQQYKSILNTHHKICNILSIEGAFKLIFGVALTISSFTSETTSMFIHNNEIGIISIVFIYAGLQEILNGYYNKLLNKEADYLITCVVFGIITLFLFAYSVAVEYPGSTIYSLACLTSVSLLMCFLLEWNFPREVVLGLMRNFLLFLLGSWIIQANFLINENNLPLLSNEISLKIAVYFAWHCGFDFIIVICIWNIVFKLSDKYYCFCLASRNCDQVDDMYLGNRVHFDMPILGRLEESETEEC